MSNKYSDQTLSAMKDFIKEKFTGAEIGNLLSRVSIPQSIRQSVGYESKLNVLNRSFDWLCEEPDKLDMLFRTVIKQRSNHFITSYNDDIEELISPEEVTTTLLVCLKDDGYKVEDGEIISIGERKTNIKSLSMDEPKNITSASQQYPYDVALSFAGEDRIHAEALADALRRRKINVFYDKYEKTTLWGKDLYTHLSDLYQKKARYCVMFFSQHYVAKTWTKHELKAAQARALNENEEYILPIRLDSTEIPGILQTTAYLDWYEETPESVAEALLEKLEEVPQVLLISERIIMDWLIDEAQLSSGRVGVDLGDVPGVKHFMSMEKDNEDWEAWYRMWFQQAFTERMGFEPTEESVEYALEKYAKIEE